jgi:hypothetical protein
MYRVYVGLLLLFLLFCGCFCWWSYEPFEGSPYEYTQGQSGEIQQLHDKVQQITLTEALLDALQSDNDQTTDKINQLQANLPNHTVKDAYP